MTTLSKYKQPALILSGGGIKAAAFHVGACLALQEQGFSFQGGIKADTSPQETPQSLIFGTYVGASAGSIICAFLASGYSIESILNSFNPNSTYLTHTDKSSLQYLRPVTYKDLFNLKITTGTPLKLLTGLFKKTPSLSDGVEALLKKYLHVSGLFTTEGIEKYLRTDVLPSNDFKDLNANLFIIATQLDYARKVIFSANTNTRTNNLIEYSNYASISQACAASAALPPAFSPYGIRKSNIYEENLEKTIYFLDGEIRDVLSTHIAADHGCDLIVASYSMQPYNYNKKFGSLINYGIPIIINQALYQAIQQKIEYHITQHTKLKVLTEELETFFKKTDLSPEDAKKAIEMIEGTMHYNRNIQYIYIHPKPEDYEMFFCGPL